MYSIYALKSAKDGRIYVGMTTNVERRFKEHSQGYVRSTKAYCPWTLIHVESCGDDRKIARSREKYFKSGWGKEFLKNL